ncbi:MAG TPA: hypothetical protein VHA11_10615 [Bryobacteraceae bacterium]|nr:hypothetical protein [Bryobacteraceae bacterium]
MPTDKQLRANRANSKKSTGPKTPEGKAAASENALRHGFRARAVVLPEEDRSEYLELLAALEAEYNPVGPTEAFFVREMATSDWHLRRHARLESGLYAARLRVMRRVEYHTDEPDDYGPQQDRTKEEVEFDDDTLLMGEAYHNAAGGDSFVKLNRYRNSARRSYYQALNALRDAQDRRRNPPQQNLPNEPNSEQPPVPSTTSALDPPCAPATDSTLNPAPVTGSRVPRRAVCAAWATRACHSPRIRHRPGTPYANLKRLALLCF